LPRRPDRIKKCPFFKKIHPRQYEKSAVFSSFLGGVLYDLFFHVYIGGGATDISAAFRGLKTAQKRPKTPYKRPKVGDLSLVKIGLKSMCKIECFTPPR
jgi:hypothetical protein